MSGPLTTRARAKVNLTLRVLGRRGDGYHELDSLVAFAGIGDSLTLEPGLPLALTIGGPRGAGLDTADNLVIRAAERLAQTRPGLALGAFHLVKRLPVASGIGGGSADAAAALRLLARLNDIAADDPLLPEVARSVGADVPVCLDSRARIMRGAGERLGEPLRLPPLFAVLANPGVAVETRAVFRELGLEPGQASPAFSASSETGDIAGDVLAALRQDGNDLEAPALKLAPGIGTVLEALRALPGCRLARMSGSGATCFALFDNCRASAAAAKTLAAAHPGWWMKPTLLR